MSRRWMVAVAILLSSSLAMAGKAKKPAKSDPPPPRPAAEAPAAAQDDAPSEAPEPFDRFAGLPQIAGPKLVDIGHGSEIELPAGLRLIEQTQAQELMRQYGNDTRAVTAMIVPQPGQGEWFVVVESEDIGYVSDDDADDLDATQLLEMIKKGSTEQNKERVKIHVPELFVDGWNQPPRYDRVQHHLVWGVDAHDTEGKSINFVTRILGRNGFIAADLVDAAETMEQAKRDAAPLLAAIRFKAGSRYSDHADGDRDSGIGLKALVLGGAGVALAKKGGLLVAILIALKKGFIFIAAAIGGFFKWLFGRGKKTKPADPPAPEPPPADPAPPVG